MPVTSSHTSDACQSAVHVFDFGNDGATIMQAFRDAAYVTHRTAPFNAFCRLGPAEFYDPEIVRELAHRLRPETMLYALPHLHRLLDEPRSVDEVHDYFVSLAQRDDSTKAHNVAHALAPWKTLLGGGASARQGPELEQHYRRIVYDLSGLPLEYARHYFGVWLIRQLCKGALAGPSAELHRVLVILQGDVLFAKEFSETTGAQVLSLSKRVLALHKFGWGVIILSQQPSELDQVIRNRCAIPVCFA